MPPKPARPVEARSARISGAAPRLRVVVSGATGNIGSHVVQQLLEHPDVGEVVGICRRPPAEVNATGLSYVALDLLDDDVESKLREVTHGADVVIHLAWRIQPSHDAAAMRRINIDGTRALLTAAVDNNVRAFVQASSVGAYSPASKDRPRDESWPTDGVPGSTYSAHKAAVESILDVVAAANPSLRIVRVRPALVLQGAAGSEIARYFIGPLVPLGLLRPGVLPVVPGIKDLEFQVVHSSDAARAFVTAATTEVDGAYNIAAEPTLDPERIAAALHARVVPVPARLLRSLVTAGWRLRLTPTDAGWLDMALNAPILDTTRARTELGWSPEHDAEETLVELLDGIADKAGGTTPVLTALPDGLRRVSSALRHLLSGGIGA